MPKRVRISLANKCQLLFGAAVVLILTAALTVGGLRMQTLVVEGQQEIARELANAWLADILHLSEALSATPTASENHSPLAQGLVVRLVRAQQFDAAQRHDPFLAKAIDQFQTRDELFLPAQDPAGKKHYRYARAVRASQLSGLRTEATPHTPPPSAIADPLKMILLIQFRADLAQRQLMLNRIYLIAAGLLAGLLAIGTFWFITTRIILSPVRVLRDTAAKVSQGDLNIRSDINTGDEFEQMSDMFNTMLENLKLNQDQLRSINKSLDLKLGELAEHNVSLYEANMLKSKFLANVSHELRTPLNSIIGFAEVLGESFQNGDAPTEDKRRRYTTNIIHSSRQLLELINDLLDLAKIEAGRMEVRVSPLSIADTAEGLINLIRPQAEKQQIRLALQVQRGIPMVHTDPGKLQQILFNFLSNAIKFTPQGGTVTLEAALLPPNPNPTPNPTEASDQPTPPQLAVSVHDTGPGIPLDQHDTIFEKFTQLDSTETREHGGTGLGLTISRELAELLQGRIALTSDVGRGATFSLIIPLVLEPKTVSLNPPRPAPDAPTPD